MSGVEGDEMRNKKKKVGNGWWGWEMDLMGISINDEMNHPIYHMHITYTYTTA